MCGGATHLDQKLDTFIETIEVHKTIKKSE